MISVDSPYIDCDLEVLEKQVFTSEVYPDAVYREFSAEWLKRSLSDNTDEISLQDAALCFAWHLYRIKSFGITIPKCSIALTDSNPNTLFCLVEKIEGFRLLTSQLFNDDIVVQLANTLVDYLNDSFTNGYAFFFDAFFEDQYTVISSNSIIFHDIQPLLAYPSNGVDYKFKVLDSIKAIKQILRYCSEDSLADIYRRMEILTKEVWEKG